jgi:hypothetical protein
MSNLPRNLRVLFGFLRIVLLINLCTTPVLFLGSSLLVKWAGTEPYYQLTIGEVALRPTAGPLEAHRVAESAPFLDLSEIRAVAKMSYSKAHSAAWNQVTIYTILVRLIASGWYYLLFTLLHRLCKRLEVGEVFADENIRTIRQIGWGLVGYGTLSPLIDGIWQWFVRDDLIGSLQISGQWATMLRIDLFHSVLNFAHRLDGSPYEIILGCLVLLLTQAFRQGLSLKAENDLTV